MPQDNGDRFIFVNTRLDAESVQELEAIKAFHGIASSSDVVRFLLRKENRLIQQQLVDPPASYHTEAIPEPAP